MQVGDAVGDGLVGVGEGPLEQFFLLLAVDGLTAGGRAS